jgi:hypothetical protein
VVESTAVLPDARRYWQALCGGPPSADRVGA